MLTELFLDFCPLSGLDVSHNPALSRLMLYGCGLESLDVTNNPALTMLSCMFNRLEELDVSMNPQLNWLLCSTNNLKVLDLSGNPALTSLSCHNNLLTELDLSNNPLIKEVHCQENYMVSPEDVKGWEELELIKNSSDDLLSGTFRFYNQYVIEEPFIVITTQPEDLELTYENGALISGNDVLGITAEVFPGGILGYKWYELPSGNYPDPSTDTLISDERFFTLTTDAALSRYYCVVSARGARDVVSDIVTVRVQRYFVIYEIQILTQPARETHVLEGNIVGKLSIEAIHGNPAGAPVYYQWYQSYTFTNEVHLATLIEGATDAEFLIPTQLQANNIQYSFFCVVTGADVPAVSDVAIVIVEKSAVIERTLECIAVTAAPVKIAYSPGETLDLAGLVVTAVYSDDGFEEVFDYTTDPADGAILLFAGSVTVTVTYAEGAAEKTTTFIITVGEEAHICEEDKGTVTLEATCKTEGLISYVCVTCGALMRAQSIPKLDHAWDEGEVTTQATKQTPGLMTFTCVLCLQTRTELIPKLPADGTVIVNGVEIEIETDGDVAILRVSNESMSAILKSSGNTIIFDLRDYANVDILVDAGIFQNTDKTIIIITTKGESSVKTKTLWNNSGKQRLLSVRGNVMSLKNV
jgi:hypothetical protein